jgi:hypothetical protein
MNGFCRAMVIGLLISGGVASAQSRRAPAPAPVVKKIAAKPVAKTTAKPNTTLVAKVEAPKPAAPKTDATVAPVVAAETTEQADAALATDTNAEPALATDAAAEPALQTDQILVKIDPRVPAPTATAIMTHYQRVGREIMQLQSFRGTECTLELWKAFRSIKIDEATATKESRIVTAAILQDIQQKISRKKGITISQQCLDNPLADGCL